HRCPRQHARRICRCDRRAAGEDRRDRGRHRHQAHAVGLGDFDGRRVMASTQTADPGHSTQAARRSYYDRISEYGLSPGWERLRELIGDEPKSQCVPAIWKFKEIRAMVMEAAELISAAEAERRVLLLENPGLPGKSRITQTLLAGLQLI